MKLPDARLLATRFAQILHAHLGDEKVREIDRCNGRAPKESWCASHDYCDANIVMEAAWVLLTGESTDPDDGSTIIAVNDAWAIARREGFMSLVEAARLQDGATKPPIRVCAVCGSDRVTVPALVNPTTGEVTILDGIDNGTCMRCGEDRDFVVPKQEGR